MNYSYPQVVFQEVPGEVSLALSISGCPLKCEGCHSAFTWDPDYGKPLTLEVLEGYLAKYAGLVTTILFYGGEWDSDLLSFIKLIHSKDIKFALYTGLSIEEVPPKILNSCDYIKVGRYEASLGGLQSKSTNQKLYERVGCGLLDITYRFTWRTDTK